MKIDYVISNVFLILFWIYFYKLIETINNKNVEEAGKYSILCIGFGLLSLIFYI